MAVDEPSIIFFTIRYFITKPDGEKTKVIFFIFFFLVAGRTANSGGLKG